MWKTLVDHLNETGLAPHGVSVSAKPSSQPLARPFLEAVGNEVLCEVMDGGGDLLEVDFSTQVADLLAAGQA